MDKPRTSIWTPALAAAVVIIIVAGGIADYAYLTYTRPCCVTTSSTSSVSTSSSAPVNLSTTTYGSNSTYTYRCPPTATCDFLLSLTVKVACTGCQFSGDYVSPSRDSTPTPVSGSGNKSYTAGSFDSPLYLAWNVSKDTAGGTLEVRVIGQEGQTYYDEATSTPFGNLVGTWVVAVVTATESQSSTS